MKGIPSDWTSDRLKDVAAINVQSLPAGTDPDFEFEYLEISNVDYYGVVDSGAIESMCFADAPSRARRVVAKNSTIISSVRPNLQAAAYFPQLPDKLLVCSTGFNVVQPDERLLNPRFLYYVLISEYARQYFEAYSTGVGYPAISDKFFSVAPIPIPPLPGQGAIAEYLDLSCAAIDAAASLRVQPDKESRSSGSLQGQMVTLVAYRKSLILECVTGRRRVTEADLRSLQGHA